MAVKAPPVGCKEKFISFADHLFALEAEVTVNCLLLIVEKTCPARKETCFVYRTIGFQQVFLLKNWVLQYQFAIPLVN